VSGPVWFVRPISRDSQEPARSLYAGPRIEEAVMTRPVALIGADFEENLSLRYLAAAVEAHGFEAVIVPFHDAAEAGAVVARVAALDPLVVGISVPFQLRAREFLDLAQSLRAARSRAHIVAGGHFATFEYDNILREFPAIDSVVRHEGEHTLVELCSQLRAGQPVDGIAGTLTRGPDGIVDGGTRRLTPLDELPLPDRRGEPHQVMGVPISPIVGSRGCYADCGPIEGYLVDRFGPKVVVLVASLLVGASWTLNSVATSLAVLYRG
jgi:radical SAM superfamily enzyme YgiQ (UPF0313 family)